MGFPLTTYTTLQALVDETRPQYERDQVREALAPFNLFAFVLHDPDAHPEFDAVMREDFDRLDYDTGDKLLFFSLVDPSPEWLERYRGRPYYEPISDATEPGDATTSEVLSAVASSFGIPPEDLPCIVVLPDLTASTFAWVRACPERIGAQLRTLGYIADRDPGAWNSIDALGELDMCGGTDLVGIGRRAANVLLDLLAFADLDRSGDVQRRSMARRAAFFRTYAEKLERARNAISSSRDIIELVAQQFLRAVGLSRRPPRQRVPVEGLELESQRIYRSSLIAEEALEYSVSRGVLRGAGAGAVDYSPSAIGLAKVFERELNLSVVHWARGEFGIELPPYFNTYAPDIQAREGRANFNGQKRGRWNPPPMGTARGGCKALAKRVGSRPPLYDAGSWDTLLRLWHGVNELRTDVAHDRLVTREDHGALKALMSDLERSGDWERMVQLKATFRGERPRPGVQ